MKIKLTDEEIQEIMEDPEKAKEAGVDAKDPWWVVVLKVLAYAIGLFFGGAMAISCVRYA